MVVLYNCGNQDTVNMMLCGSYTFNATFNTLYHFQINCNVSQGLVAGFTYEPLKPTIEDIIQFNDTSTAFGGSIVNWTWDFGDGNVSYTRNTTHQYSNPGIYNVSLTVRDDNDVEDSYETAITVYNVHHIISLDHRWNLISIPFNESLHKTDIIVRNNSIDYTWSEAVSEGIILGFLYSWDSTSQAYLTTDTLEPGYGSLIWTYHDCELLVFGNISDDRYITSLNMRWNMMGLPYNESIHKENLTVHYNVTDYSWLNATTNNNEEGEPLILGFIYGWNAGTQNYMLSDALNPGYGYWMYAYYNCTLFRPAT